MGWRYVFVASGLLGLLWLAPWLTIYHPLKSHPRVSVEERQLIEAGRDTATASRRSRPWRYLVLLKQPNVWGIVLGRAFSDPIWWFYVFCIPQYLSDARGFSLKQIGIFAWIPFLAADLGNFTGGFGSGASSSGECPSSVRGSWCASLVQFPCLPRSRSHMRQMPIGL